MSKCSWPFHSDPTCVECVQLEDQYGDGVDEWLKQRAEIRAAAKAALFQEGADRQVPIRSVRIPYVHT